MPELKFGENNRMFTSIIIDLLENKRVNVMN